MSAREDSGPPLDEWRRAVVAHYEARLREFGPTAQGMDWKDEASQSLRFRTLCAGFDLAGRRILEVGAGAGHLYDYLRAHGIEADYTGLDASAEMVAAARARHPDVRFECGDLSAGTTDGDEAFDVVLCSGVFHVKLDAPEAEWETFVHGMLRAMYARCREGIGFNLMSDQVDYRSPDLFYADPARFLDFCRGELSRYVTLRHDYPLYEFTVHVHRSPRSE
jgi:SAM-dependent methyltransferase